MRTLMGTLERRRNHAGAARIAALTCAALLLVSAHASAQQGKTENTQAGSRTEITINDTRVSPENLTSSQDGTVFFGSTAKGTIYRAAPRQGASRGVDSGGRSRAHQCARRALRREVEHAVGVRQCPVRAWSGPGRAAGAALLRPEDGQGQRHVRIPERRRVQRRRRRGRRDRVCQRHLRRASAPTETGCQVTRRLAGRPPTARRRRPQFPGRRCPLREQLLQW